MVVAASGSPMLVGHTAAGDFASSDIIAVAEWVDEFYALEDGDVVELARTSRIGERGGATAPIGRCVRGRHAIELNGCIDYLARSLDEQSVATGRVPVPGGGGVSDAELWRDLDLPPFQRLRIVGCGPSLNSGRVIGDLARRLGGLSTHRSVRTWADIVEAYRPGVTLRRPELRRGTGRG